MKLRPLITYASLAVLVGLSAYILFFKTGRGSVTDAQSQAFAFADTAHISRIVVTEKGGTPQDLTRKAGNRWLINGRTEAAPALVELMLATLHDLKMKRPVSRSEREEVVRALAVAHQHIQVYREGNQALSFYMGSETDQHQGNYALIDGAEQPYVIHLANFEGYPGLRFAINEQTWRSKHLFRSSPRSLQRVQVSYVREPDQNLDIRFEGRSYKVAGLAPAELDTARLVGLLGSLSQIFVEQYIKDAHLADSLSKQAAPVTVQVTDLDPAKSHTLKLWPANYKAEGWSTNGYIADLGLAVTMQPQSVTPMLVRLKELRKSPAAPAPVVH